MSHKPTILIIDDEPAMRRLLNLTLAPHGYSLIEAVHGNEGLALAASHVPDLVILDLGLPDLSGEKVLERLREWYRKPIIILSARDSEESIVAALDKGADDYLTKPFNHGELLARIRVALRHYEQPASEPIFQTGDLRIDFTKRVVTLRDEVIRLTSTEYDLLRLFAMHPDKVLTHSQILKEIWGPKSTEHVHYLRVYIGHLRQKIEEDTSQPRILITEPGVGYRLKTDRSE